jgi:saccharopine dehydrogenase (NAD+, L-lysine forming)
LIPGKTYLFFSHTIKKQPQNQKLLQSILEKKIRMIDYECLRDSSGERIIAFGRYAGIVGTYNALLIYGKKYNLFELKPAYQCFDLNEVKDQLKKVKLSNIKIVITGGGRVANGSKEILDLLKIKKVSPEEIITKNFDEPVYAQLHSKDYNTPHENSSATDSNFYKNPEKFKSDFQKYLGMDMLIACAYWDPKAPRLFTKEDMRLENFKLTVIADITCDIQGSIPSTIKPSTIFEPAYDYNRFTNGIEAPFSDPKNVTVMAIDHLPGELPRDSSNDFGIQLMKNVLPYLLSNTPNPIIEGATIAQNGSLTAPYVYLQDYVNK